MNIYDFEREHPFIARTVIVFFTLCVMPFFMLWQFITARYDKKYTPTVSPSEDPTPSPSTEEEEEEYGQG